MAQIHALTPEGRLPSAAVGHVKEVLDPVQFARPAPAADVDLDDIWVAGTYPLTATPVSWEGQHYPWVGGRGVLTVQPWSAGNGAQTFVGAQTGNPRVLVRYKQGGVLGPWKNISDWAEGDTTTLNSAKTYADSINLIRPFVNGATDLDAVDVDGDYPLISTVTDWQAQHYPANIRGHLAVRRAGAWRFQMIRSNALTNPQMWIRHKVGTWSAWVEITNQTPPVIAQGVGRGSIRHDMLVDDMRAYHGGGIGTGGAVPVALTFDDYPRDFRDLMRDALTSRGIPYTLALSSGMYDPAAATDPGTWGAIYAGAQGTTWAEINGWLVPDGAEVANHSRRHSGGVGVDWLRAEIVDGLTELQAALPSQRIWCWIQPSATYVDDGGPFNNGDSINAFAQTIAGKLIWDHHAMITGTRLINGSRVVPRRGDPVQGITRAWISSTAGISGTQADITAAHATGGGIVIGSHANDISEGRITAAQFEGFLDWLIAEQTAGRVRLMTLSQWAVADTRFPA